MASTRLLAAILAADVAGYSRLMGQDEEGTHERLQSYLRELVDPKIEEHRGRTVKNTGDGLLAEFPSVVDAVRCAVKIQRGVIKREPNVPEERRIRLRIGINLGDVIVEEHDIFGDGVNVAARLGGLAEPGGICVSRMVRDQIRDKLPYPLEDIGEQSVKNIARPVRVYALRPEAIAELPASSGPPTTSSPQPVGAPRLSIVVLPFSNLSDDPGQQYFADGIIEDLTTDLSRIAGMLVISRNTAFTYQGKRVDTKQIGRELCVRYVLEGSVRRLGNQIRVNAQLIDAETDGHLWAERFDGNTSDLFALQDEITSRIAIALDLALNEAEAVRPTKYPDVQDYIFRGRAVASKPPTRDDYAEAIRLFELALVLDTWFAEAQASLADVLVGRVLDQMTDTPATDIGRAEDLVAQALVASPRNLDAHYAKANILRQMGRYEADIPKYQTVIELDRNAPGSYANLGWSKLLTGSISEAIPALEQALRLSPRDTRAGNWSGRIALVHLLQSRSDEAILWCEKARSASPGLPYVHAHLAADYALNGEMERAVAPLAEARRLSGDNRYSSITALQAAVDFGCRKFARYSKPPILLVSARLECRKSDPNPPSCRDLGG
jgi:TolB-like protein/class 3 adenylate cyclase/Flp pilus assembly protein TadD